MIWYKYNFENWIDDINNCLGWHVAYLEQIDELKQTA